MTGILIASALLASGFFGQAAPTNLVTEQGTTPVTDHRPEFRAQNNISPSADRFQIQVSTDPTFATVTHWNSAAAGLSFPGVATVANGANSPEIQYGEGTSPLTNVPYLDWNKTFFWRTRFRQSNGGNPFSPFSANGQFTMAAPTRSISQHSNNGSPTGPSWRFVGVPIAFGTTVPATELLGTFSPLLRLDEATRTWTQLTASDVLEGGRGYMGWSLPTAVMTLNQGKVTAGIPAVKDGAGSTVTPSYLLTNNFSFTTLAAPTGQEIKDGVPANEYRGNHLFANPFYAPISWRSSTNAPPAGFAYGHIARSNISYAMYKWDGTQYLTYNGVTDAGTAGEWIEPFQAVGIWVEATPYQLYVNTPTPLTGGPLKAGLAARSLAAGVPAPDPDNWHLRIEAVSGAAIDTENVFGINPEADDTWDIRDSEEPGAGTATWLLVSFDHRSDWTTHSRKFTHDYKKTRVKAGEEVVWSFTVDGNTGLPATLTWPNLSDIPATDWKFTLEDPATASVIDLSTTASYDTQAVTGPSTLTLRATRLKDSPAQTPVSESGGGGNCGLLGFDGLLIAAALLARRIRR